MAISKSHIELAKRQLDRADTFNEALVKMLFAINGGALIAVLALMGQLFEDQAELSQWLLIPCLAFTIGLLAPVLKALTMTVRKLEQAAELLIEALKPDGDLIPPGSKAFAPKGMSYAYVSVSSFILGCFLVLLSFYAHAFSLW